MAYAAALHVITTCTAVPLKLLHQRLMHTSAARIVSDVNSGSVSDTTILGKHTLSRCNCCQCAKLRRTHFKQEKSTKFDLYDKESGKLMTMAEAKEAAGVIKPGRIVHMDGVGPMEVPDIHGHIG